MTDSILDKADCRILSLLQRDCLLPAETIAEKIGLSASSVLRRVKKLRGDGVIRGQVAVVDTNKLGVHLTFVTVLEIVKEQKEQLAKLQYWLTHEISVQQAFYTTGSADLYLIVVAANVESYNDVTQRLVAANPIIRRVTTNVTLQTFKKGIFVPTNHDYDSLPR
ncbi:hypothetical protein B0D71_02840 [Pseudomonas laurylsulfativorans]|uniref:HTH asnC-type domain-containing protein n=1 Tax=Pseudomonas laurylsulfativorans TaxID=1943631 RepID=A0A2S3VV00_9PSED|nr:hypothetical protein B0D71_02840 [Pseudomonas laurylsulfativorans]